MPSSPQANIKENKQPVQIAKSIKDLEKILKNVGRKFEKDKSNLQHSWHSQPASPQPGPLPKIRKS